jgi:hypothetical protein
MYNKEVKIGLGEAVSRLLKLELTRINGLYKMPELAIKERDMLFSALNEIKIDLGFDCDGDGVPDTVEIFEQSANTSCCRISSLSEASSDKVEVKSVDMPKKSTRGRRKRTKKQL